MKTNLQKSIQAKAEEIRASASLDGQNWNEIAILLEESLKYVDDAVVATGLKKRLDTANQVIAHGRPLELIGFTDEENILFIKKDVGFVFSECGYGRGVEVFIKR